MTKSDLCRKYVECKKNNSPEAESYLSAIIYKFWHILNKDYYSQDYKLAGEDDMYQFYIDSILYVLDNHVWDDENSTVYNDEKGPEKCIVTRIKSNKINFFVSLQRQKRKVDSDSISLDALEEESSDGYFMPTYDKPDMIGEFLKNKVRKEFYSYKYFQAFGIDILLNGDVYDLDEDEQSKFNPKKFKRMINTMDDEYCNVFSEMYEIPLQEVLNAFNIIKNNESLNIYQSLRQLLYELTTDRNLMMQLRS